MRRSAPQQRQSGARLGGATSPLFEHVFGFSLAELASGEQSLQHANLNEALYGNALGGLATFLNPERRLRPGLFARADLGVAERTGVPVVPDQAVLQRTDGSVVFTYSPRDGRVSRRPIRVAGFGEGRVEVASGIAPGELVVTRGQAGLVDGQLVRLSDDAGQAPAPAAEPNGAAVAAQPTPGEGDTERVQ